MTEDCGVVDRTPGAGVTVAGEGGQGRRGGGVGGGEGISSVVKTASSLTRIKGQVVQTHAVSAVRALETNDSVRFLFLKATKPDILARNSWTGATVKI